MRIAWKENCLGQGNGIKRVEPEHYAWSEKTVLAEWAYPVINLLCPRVSRLGRKPSEYEWKLGANPVIENPTLDKDTLMEAQARVHFTSPKR